jgi:copper transporter 1
VGLCIGLFLLAILDRYLHALWRACTAAWARGQVGFVLPRAGGAEPSNVNMVVRAEDEDDGGSARAVPIIAQPTAVSSAVSLVSELEKSCCARKDKDASTTTDSSNSLAKEKTDEFAPAPCQCGCGGECGAGSAPVYSEVEPEPATRARSIKSIVTPAYAYLPAAAQRNLDPRRERRWSRPFRWGADVPRGFLWAVQTIVHFLVM